MKGYLAFGKQSAIPDAAETVTRFWPFVTAESVCSCGHTNALHGYVDGFWANIPDTEPCSECSCADFTLAV